MDATLGELQYVIDAGNNGERIPMHGAQGREGVVPTLLRAASLTLAAGIYAINTGADPTCNQSSPR